MAGAGLTDGRYEGGDEQVFVDLRLDGQGAGVVSADLYRNREDYVASVRTAPGVQVSAKDSPWPAVWQDSLGDTCTGSLALTPGGGADFDEATVTATLRLDRRLNGLPAAGDLTVDLRRTGSELRRLGVEVEVEAGLALPEPVDFGGVERTFEGCFTRAGFAVHMVGEPTTVPAQPDGWNASVISTILHDLMQRSAQSSIASPVWELHLLMLSQTTRRGLSGIMFDDVGLQRQGAAVFVDAIRSDVDNPVPADHRIVRTTVHELGHALNLAHRFERVVGRADSTSFMNYDWRYLGGGKAADYWDSFGFSFDPDELEFLRHAPKAALIPGGAAFHSVQYWAEGTGGYSPYVPEVPASGFRLTLSPPAAGPVFAFGQPVFLEVTLQNLTTGAVTMPPEILDPKAGVLEILVRKHSGQISRGLVDAVPFVPILQRCFDLEATDLETVPPGGTLRNNLNLTFGSGGFTFAEPGEYEITPLLGIHRQIPGNEPGDEPVTVELVIRGEPLRLRVAHPMRLSEEHDALTLFRPDVGSWFALGGSDHLDQARDDLLEISERRTAEMGTDDPVVAAIVRAEGIHAGRPSVRYTDSGFTQAPADEDRAADLLGSLNDQALTHFDAHTAEHTKLLAGQYAH